MISSHWLALWMQLVSGEFIFIVKFPCNQQRLYFAALIFKFKVMCTLTMKRLPGKLSPHVQQPEAVG